ncbi:MAG: alpha/beta fold hydrolase [Phycisphaerales bacterium]|nr:alpha/beta fold hydrolase [Phycisphaerales bacterium]
MLERRISIAIFVVLVVPPVLAQAPAPAASHEAPGAVLEAARPGTLRAARDGFATNIVNEQRVDAPIDEAPPALFSMVTYPAPLGANAAYLTPTPHDGERHAAIVWITGGWPTARGGSYVWTPGELENEQSASAYRDAGVVMMFPTVRGTCQNPGAQEAMFGEVDDVIAAAVYLRTLDYVDPDRIYLGGHSTGGTLVLLVAEATDVFRGVFSFGPAAEFADYGDRDWPFDVRDEREFQLRSPVHYLDSIASPTYVFEGEHGRSAELMRLDEATANPNVHFLVLEDGDHFSPLAPVNRLLARMVASLETSRFEIDLGVLAAGHRAALAARDAEPAP